MTGQLAGGHIRTELAFRLTGRDHRLDIADPFVEHLGHEPGVFLVGVAHFQRGVAPETSPHEAALPVRGQYCVEEMMQLRLGSLARERSAREAEIDSLLNRAPGSPLGRPPEIQPQEFGTPVEELYAGASGNAPMLLRDQKMIQRAQIAVDIARKEYYPDYTVSVGYFNQGSMPAMYQARVDFKLPAWFWRKQRAGLTEQAEGLAESRHTYEAANQALRFRIQDDYLMATTSSKLMKLYGQTVVPQATLALESSLASYETGAVDFLSVLTNYIAVTEVQMNYQEQLQNFYLALSRLEEMTAMPLIK